jgi:hypothetical protein
LRDERALISASGAARRVTIGFRFLPAKPGGDLALPVHAIEVSSLLPARLLEVVDQGVEFRAGHLADQGVDEPLVSLQRVKRETPRVGSLLGAAPGERFEGLLNTRWRWRPPSWGDLPSTSATPSTPPISERSGIASMIDSPSRASP